MEISEKKKLKHYLMDTKREIEYCLNCNIEESREFLIILSNSLYCRIQNDNELLEEYKEDLKKLENKFRDLDITFPDPKRQKQIKVTESLKSLDLKALKEALYTLYGIKQN